MRFILSTILLISVNICNAGMTFRDAQEVYNRLTQRNNFYLYPELKFNPSSEINAQTTPWFISINSGMLSFVKNADELALILGHELGHFKRGDPESRPDREYASDALGAKYEDNAGYNHCVGVEVLRRFNTPDSKTHPNSESRYQRLKCV